MPPKMWNWTLCLAFVACAMGDLPTMNNPDPPRSIMQDSGPHFLQLTGLSAGAGDPNQRLRKIDVSSDNPELIDLAISYTEGESTARLTFEPRRGQHGQAMITILIIDDALEAITKTFFITVDPKPVSCEYGQWSSWSECSKRCNTGTQSRTRRVQVEAAFGGRECQQSLLRETVECSGRTCAPPTLDPISDRSVVQDTPGLQEVFLTGITDGGDGDQMVEVRASARDTSRIYNLGVKYNYPDTSAAVTYSLRPGVTGDVIVTVSVVDSEEDFTSRNFRLTILPESRPQDCQWDWRGWSSCSATCGTGVQTRQSYVTQQARNGGNSCASPMPQEERTCNTMPCPVDCATTWGQWSSCSHTCGGGVKTRVQAVSRPAMHGGLGCPSLRTEEQPCNQHTCPIDCQFEWSEWSGCSQTCGGGQRSRRSNILVRATRGGALCPVDDIEYQECGARSCPIDCQYAWSEWSQCSKACGGGTRRKRYDVTVLAANGGLPCLAEPDRETQEEPCNQQSCQASEEQNPHSCRGHCNNISPGGCGCDPTCSQYNDCCDDYADVCLVNSRTGSCVGRCGDATSTGVTCWCDDFCSTHGDCCDDYQRACGHLGSNSGGGTSTAPPPEMLTCSNRCFKDDRADTAKGGTTNDGKSSNNLMQNMLMMQAMGGHHGMGGGDMVQNALMMNAMAGDGSMNPLVMTAMMNQGKGRGREFRPQRHSQQMSGMYGPSQVGKHNQHGGHSQSPYSPPHGSNSVPIATLMMANMASGGEVDPLTMGLMAGADPMTLAMMSGQDDMDPLTMSLVTGIDPLTATLMSGKGDDVDPLTMSLMTGMDPLTATMVSGGSSQDMTQAMMMSHIMDGGFSRASGHHHGRGGGSMFRALDLDENSTSVEEESTGLPPVEFIGVDSRFQSASPVNVEQEEEEDTQAGAGAMPFSVPDGFSSAVGVDNKDKDNKVKDRISIVDPYAQEDPNANLFEPEYTIQLYNQPQQQQPQQYAGFLPPTEDLQYQYDHLYEEQQHGAQFVPPAQPLDVPDFAPNTPTGRLTQQNSFAPSNLYGDSLNSYGPSMGGGVSATAMYPPTHVNDYYPPRHQGKGRPGKGNGIKDLIPLLLLSQQGGAAATAASAAPITANRGTACYCDQSCMDLGDCCNDFVTLCDKKDESGNSVIQSYMMTHALGMHVDPMQLMMADNAGVDPLQYAALQSGRVDAMDLMMMNSVGDGNVDPTQMMLMAGGHVDPMDLMLMNAAGGDGGMDATQMMLLADGRVNAQDMMLMNAVSGTDGKVDPTQMMLMAGGHVNPRDMMMMNAMGGDGGMDATQMMLLANGRVNAQDLMMMNAVGGKDGKVDPLQMMLMAEGRVDPVQMMMMNAVGGDSDIDPLQMAMMTGQARNMDPLTLAMLGGGGQGGGSSNSGGMNALQMAMMTGRMDDLDPVQLAMLSSGKVDPMMAMVMIEDNKPKGSCYNRCGLPAGVVGGGTWNPTASSPTSYLPPQHTFGAGQYPRPRGVGGLGMRALDLGEEEEGAGEADAPAAVIVEEDEALLPGGSFTGIDSAFSNNVGLPVSFRRTSGSNNEISAFANGTPLPEAEEAEQEENKAQVNDVIIPEGFTAAQSTDETSGSGGQNRALDLGAEEEEGGEGGDDRWGRTDSHLTGSFGGALHAEEICGCDRDCTFLGTCCQDYYERCPRVAQNNNQFGTHSPMYGGR